MDLHLVYYSFEKTFHKCPSKNITSLLVVAFVSKLFVLNHCNTDDNLEPTLLYQLAYIDFYNFIFCYLERTELRLTQGTQNNMAIYTPCTFPINFCQYQSRIGEV